MLIIQMLENMPSIKLSVFTFLLLSSVFATAAVKGISQPTYEKMTEAQTLMDAENFSGAKVILEELLKDKLNEHERAQVLSLIAGIHYQNEEYEKAAKGFESVYKTEDIPEGLRQYAIKALMQLAFTLEDYPQVISYAELLLKAQEIPDANIYVFMSQAYIKMEQFEAALKPIKIAITLARDAGQPPKENWLLILNAIYYNLKDYKSMLAVYKELNALYPKKRYVVNMASIYGQLENTKSQMLLLEPLYDQGNLTEQSHLLNLANLYMLHKVPVKGARLIESGMKQGNIERTQRNLELLAQAWQLAAEDEKTLEPLQEAAKLAKNGKTYLQLANIYMNLYRWEDAEGAFESAIKKGGLQKEGNVYLLLGMSRFYQKNYELARKAFEDAKKDDSIVKLADQWLNYLQQEVDKRAMLN